MIILHVKVQHRKSTVLSLLRSIEETEEALTLVTIDDKHERKYPLYVYIRRTFS